VDTVTLVYVLGVLNFHGLVTQYLNAASRENIEREKVVNEKFSEIVKDFEWTTKKNH
jgi:hypothetical protein